MLTRSASQRLMRRPRRALGWRTMRTSAKVLTILLITSVLVPVSAGGVAIATLLFARLPGSLPEQRPAFEALPSNVYDSAGNLIATFRDFDLTVPVRKEDVPQVMKDAVVAGEDHRFWDHNGVDLQGIARAAWVNYQGGETLQGGSTITQQYIKNSYLTSDRTVSRKLREALLATQLERRMTKEDILFNYLNTVYFGSGAYGIGAAAESYFGKTVSQLTLSESALLAGLIPAPTAWSPRTNVAEADARRQLVLDTMAGLGMINQTQANEAKAQKVWLASDGPAPSPATVIQPPEKKGAIAYPYFVDWIEAQLLEKYGAQVLYRGGLRIETTIDPNLQQLAQSAVQARLDVTDPSVEMSMVTIDPANGHVKAMVGGRDWNASQVNLATGGSVGFQAGSSFKVFTLATALENGYKPDSTVPAPAVFRVPGCDGEGCTIKNSEGSGYGSATLRQATISSINTAYANLTSRVGVDRVAEMANRLGVKSIVPGGDYGLSLTLGAYEVSPLEMASGYATIANGGVRQDPTGVLRVFDKSGKLIEDNSARSGTRVLATGVATTVTDMLKGVITSGTGRGANINRPAAGKTGTTDDYHDAWFVGYTPQLSTAVWMGHRDEVRTLGYVTGGSYPATAWATFMRGALVNQPPTDFPPPGPLPVDTPQASDGSPSPGGGGGAPSGFGKPEDPTIRPGAQDDIIETPNDCGGPCRL
jgi:penicillin-binding protein 1A